MRQLATIHAGEVTSSDCFDDATQDASDWRVQLVSRFEAPFIVERLFSDEFPGVLRVVIVDANNSDPETLQLDFGNRDEWADIPIAYGTNQEEKRNKAMDAAQRVIEAAKRLADEIKSGKTKPVTKPTGRLFIEPRIVELPIVHRFGR